MNGIYLIVENGGVVQVIGSPEGLIEDIEKHYDLVDYLSDQLMDFNDILVNEALDLSMGYDSRITQAKDFLKGIEFLIEISGKKESIYQRFNEKYLEDEIGWRGN